MKEEEIWRGVEGFSKYAVSNLGRVKNQKKDRILSDQNHLGYRAVWLFQNGKSKFVRVHRLVAAAFLIKDPFGVRDVVNHKDCDKTNNCVSNLELVTQADNIKHAVANNLMATGERNGRNKFPDKMIEEAISLRDLGFSLAYISNLLGMSKNRISAVHIKRRKEKWPD